MDKWQHFRNTWFLLFSVLFLLHLLFERLLMIRLPFADNYLDPLLFMPILLHCILWEQRFIYKKGVNFKFGVYEIIIWWIIISILTEYFFPKWNFGFTADIWDVFCYGLGTLFFMIFMNKPLNKIEQ